MDDRLRYISQKIAIDRGQATQSINKDAWCGGQDLLRHVPEGILETAQACSLGHSYPDGNLWEPEAGTIA